MFTVCLQSCISPSYHRIRSKTSLINEQAFFIDALSETSCWSIPKYSQQLANNKTRLNNQIHIISLSIELLTTQAENIFANMVNVIGNVCLQGCTNPTSDQSIKYVKHAVLQTHLSMLAPLIELHFYCSLLTDHSSHINERISVCELYIFHKMNFFL